METSLTSIANVVFQEELGAQSHDGEGQQEVSALFIAIFKIVGTATTLQLLWLRLQTIVSHSFLHRFLRFFK